MTADDDRCVLLVDTVVAAMHVLLLSSPICEEMFPARKIMQDHASMSNFAFAHVVPRLTVGL